MGYITSIWASIPKVVGSIPTVARHIFKPARCGYTLRVTSQASINVLYIFGLNFYIFAYFAR
jgi:hypothetical protein